MIVVNTKIQILPIKAVKIPALSAFLDGRLVIKSQSILCNPSIRMEPINIAKSTKPKRVQAIPQPRNIWSLSLFFLILFIFLPEFFPDSVTNSIKQEGEDEQGNSRSKDRSVFQGSMLDVSQAHLYNIGSNGFYRNGGVKC